MGCICWRKCHWCLLAGSNMCSVTALLWPLTVNFAPTSHSGNNLSSVWLKKKKKSLSQYRRQMSDQVCKIKPWRQQEKITVKVNGIIKLVRFGVNALQRKFIYFQSKKIWRDHVGYEVLDACSPWKIAFVWQGNIQLVRSRLIYSSPLALNHSLFKK